MKLFTRTALLGAVGLALLTLPAYAQRPYDASAGSVGFKQSKQTQQQLAQRPEFSTSAGSVGFKKSKKKKAKK